MKKNKILYICFFYLLSFICTYTFFIFPFEILSEYILNDKTSFLYSLINTIIFNALIIYYLKSHNTFKPLKIFVYEGLGIGFISFGIITLGILLNFLTGLNDFIIGVTCLVLIILLVIYGIFKGRKIIIKNIQLFSSKITKDYNFIFISDVHLGTNDINHFLKILKKIKKLKYDFILIGGDLIDSSTFDINQLKVLNKINQDIYFVNGNHEYYLKDYKNKIEKIKNQNINLLKNKSMTINEINLIGIDDFQSEVNKIKHVNTLENKEKFNLVMSHKPDIWDNVNNNTHLMLCGHTHNGQIFPFNFLVRIKFKYIYGLYKKRNNQLYVSSGAGCWGPKIRLGTSNEIIKFKLSKHN